MSHATYKIQKSIRKHAKEGDMIQFYDKKDKWFRTVVVHYKTNHKVYYTAHSDSHLHKRLRRANVGRHGRSKIIKYRLIHTKM
ncbi:hypothetical protein ACVQ8P_08445 [Dellaglioa sp. BT-FLS60]